MCSAFKFEWCHVNLGKMNAHNGNAQWGYHFKVYCHFIQLRTINFFASIDGWMAASLWTSSESERYWSVDLQQPGSWYGGTGRNKAEGPSRDLSPVSGHHFLQESPPNKCLKILMMIFRLKVLYKPAKIWPCQAWTTNWFHSNFAYLTVSIMAILTSFSMDYEYVFPPILKQK